MLKPLIQPIDIEKEKKEILNKYKSLLRVCADKTDKKDKKEIRKAFNLAVDAHKNMRRKYKLYFLHWVRKDRKPTVLFYQYLLKQEKFWRFQLLKLKKKKGKLYIKITAKKLKQKL